MLLDNKKMIEEQLKNQLSFKYVDLQSTFDVSSFENEKEIEITLVGQQRKHTVVNVVGIIQRLNKIYGVEDFYLHSIYTRNKYYCYRSEELFNNTTEVNK